VDWKGEKKEIDRWPNFRGYSGKLPRVNDGALLFLIHMIAKYQPWQAGDYKKPGSRIAIVFNGSPLFTGGAGSGESEIRRWIIENGWLEAIVALPEQMFYNTGIGKVGYEINFNREFFQYQPPRPLNEIDRELAAVEQRIMALLREVTE
jgi:type I restriction enzyme M protein